MKGRSVQTFTAGHWHVKELFTVLLCPQSLNFDIPLEQFRGNSQKAVQLLEKGGKSLAAREFLRALSVCLAHPDTNGGLYPVIRVEKERGSVIYATDLKTPRVTLGECWQSFVTQLDGVVGLETTQIPFNSLESYDTQSLVVYGRRKDSKAPVEIGVNSILTLKDIDRIRGDGIADSELKSYVTQKDYTCAVVAAWKCDQGRPFVRASYIDDYPGEMKVVFNKVIKESSHEHFVTPEWTEYISDVIQTVGEKENNLRKKEKEALKELVSSLSELSSRSQHRLDYIPALKEFATHLSTISTFTRTLTDHRPVEWLINFVESQLALFDNRCALDSETELLHWHATARKVEEHVQALETNFETIQPDEAVQSIRGSLVSLATQFTGAVDSEIASRQPALLARARFENIHRSLKEAEIAAQTWINCGANVDSRFFQDAYDDLMGEIEVDVLELEKLSPLTEVSDKVAKLRSKIADIATRVASLERHL